MGEVKKLPRSYMQCGQKLRETKFTGKDITGKIMKIMQNFWENCDFENIIIIKKKLKA